MCKSWCELVVAILVIVFALWETQYSQWILVALGVILAIHSFACKKCFMCGDGVATSKMDTSSKSSSKGKKKK
jgi:hypothetical protein